MCPVCDRRNDPQEQARNESRITAALVNSAWSFGSCLRLARFLPPVLFRSICSSFADPGRQRNSGCGRIQGQVALRDAIFDPDLPVSSPFGFTGLFFLPVVGTFAPCRPVIDRRPPSTPRCTIPGKPTRFHPPTSRPPDPVLFFEVA